MILHELADELKLKSSEIRRIMKELGHKPIHVNAKMSEEAERDVRNYVSVMSKKAEEAEEESREEEQENSDAAEPQEGAQEAAESESESEAQEPQEEAQEEASAEPEEVTDIPEVPQPVGSVRIQVKGNQVDIPANCMSNLEAWIEDHGRPIYAQVRERRNITGIAVMNRSCQKAFISHKGIEQLP